MCIMSCELPKHAFEVRNKLSWQVFVAADEWLMVAVEWSKAVGETINYCDKED